MATMPIYGKNLKKSSSPELFAHLPKTSRLASGTLVVQSLYQLRLYVKLGQLNGKDKFSLRFLNEKS